MDLINKLASKNLDVSKKDSYGNTAFHVAAKSGNIAVFEILKDKKKKHQSSKNEEVLIITLKFLLHLISSLLYYIFFF